VIVFLRENVQNAVFCSG